MSSVLLRFRMSGLLDEYPNLAAYVTRGEATTSLPEGICRTVGDQCAAKLKLARQAKSMAGSKLEVRRSV